MNSEHVITKDTKISGLGKKLVLRDTKGTIIGHAVASRVANGDIEIISTLHSHKPTQMTSCVPMDVLGSTAMTTRKNLS